jgi:hypothetical protein
MATIIPLISWVERDFIADYIAALPIIFIHSIMSGQKDQASKEQVHFGSR